MTKEQKEFLQMVAAVTMLIDHVGMLFFPEVVVLRAIGRLSFPIFAFCIAEGVANTAHFWRYFGRILLVAMVSQPLYWLLFRTAQANPLFMLAWGAAALYFWRKNSPEGYMTAALLLFASYWGNMSYGWYGVWTIFLFGYFRENRETCFFGQAALTLFYSWSTGVWLQGLSLLSFVFLERGWSLREKHLPRYFFYGFYPGHLAALLGIRLFL